MHCRRRTKSFLLAQGVAQGTKTKAEHDDLVQHIVDLERLAHERTTTHATKIDEYERHIVQIGLDHKTEVEHLKKHAMLQSTALQRESSEARAQAQNAAIRLRCVEKDLEQTRHQVNDQKSRISSLEASAGEGELERVKALLIVSDAKLALTQAMLERIAGGMKTTVGKHTNSTRSRRSDASQASDPPHHDDYYDDGHDDHEYEWEEDEEYYDDSDDDAVDGEAALLLGQQCGTRSGASRATPRANYPGTQT